MKDLPAKIKERLTIRIAARMIGVELPERDGVKFRSPFRPDQTPSCSIKGDRLTDWSRGESYDAIALYAHGKGMSDGEAIKLLARDFNLINEPKPEAVASWPAFDNGTPTDAATLMELRGYQISGLRHARNLGLLRFATVCGFRSWIVTDSAGKLAQARRLDGKPYPEFGKVAARKSHTLKGSKQSWPLGIMQATEKPLMMMVEGGPDLISACCVVAELNRGDDVGVVAMLGASNEIPAGALPHFQRKRVRIYQHDDKAGRIACIKWAAQIAEAGGRADGFRFTGEGVHDLNDYLRANASLENLIK